MLKGIAHTKMNILFIYSEKGCDLLQNRIIVSGEIKIYCIYNTVHIIFIILVYTHKNKKVSS